MSSQFFTEDQATSFERQRAALLKELKLGQSWYADQTEKESRRLAQKVKEQLEALDLVEEGRRLN